MTFTTFRLACTVARTMLTFNADEFTVINKMRTGVTATHKHDNWGVQAASNKCATALEAAYPMTLTRAIAAQFVLALQNRGIRMPPETLTALGASDNATLATMRFQTGLHPSHQSCLL